MTPDKTPTDAEILALLAEKKPMPSLVFLAKDDAKLADVQAAAVAIVRVGLAKWGSPVVEPEGWITWWPTAAGVRDPIYSHGPKKPSHGAELDARLRKYPVFTTPQPTQAQAGAVPLTDEQLETAWNALQDRRATKAAEEFNARIGKNCSQCGTGAYRADGNGYHSFHRCDACHHVPMWTADGSEWSAPRGIKEGGQHADR